MICQYFRLFSLGEVLEIATRHAVENVHVTFARLALMEGDALVMRAAYPIRILERNLSVGAALPLAQRP